MKAQVLICHAYNTLPDENWYHRLADELGTREFEANVLTFPHPEAPTESAWVDRIKQAHTSEPLILVGHSLGCRAILAYLNQYDVQAKNIILVACPMHWEGIIETRPNLKAYVDGMQPLDFAKIKQRGTHFDLFHDTTDALLPIRNVESLKEVLGGSADVHISNTYEHFDVPSIPELLDFF